MTMWLMHARATAKKDVIATMIAILKIRKIVPNVYFFLSTLLKIFYVVKTACCSESRSWYVIDSGVQSFFSSSVTIAREYMPNEGYN